MYLDAETVLWTMTKPMKRLTQVGRDELQVWPYVEDQVLDPYEVAERDVECIYRSADDRYDHVLIPTTTDRTYLVTIVDRREQAVVGHHVFVLSDQYS